VLPIRHNLTSGFSYLVYAKPERGTLREALRSGAPLDPIKIVRKIRLIDRTLCSPDTQIKGIAQVLFLVHTMDPPIFHGDLNCVRALSMEFLRFHAYGLQTSIVVDEDWNPLLQDFRLSKVPVTPE
jgi:hypothetical protein